MLVIPVATATIAKNADARLFDIALPLYVGLPQLARDTI